MRVSDHVIQLCLSYTLRPSVVSRLGMSSKQSLLKNVILSAIICLLFFTILEVLLRSLLDFKSPARRAEIEYVVDKDILWKNKPNQHVVHQSEGVEYIINSRGMRCPDFPVEKPEGEVRLLIVGDSVTFGYKVTEGEDYPHILQKYLEGHYHGLSPRVLNAGVNGYSTREESMFLDREGSAFRPDIAIIGFVLNDASPYARAYQRGQFRDLLNRSGRYGIMAGAYDLLQRLYVVRSIGWLTKMSRRWAKPERDLHELRKEINRDEMELDTESAVEGFAEALEDLNDMFEWSREHEAEVLLVCFPIRFQLEERPVPGRPQKRLAEFCRSLRVPFLDLLPAFREQAEDDLFLDITHLSPAGNDLAARTIGDYLINSDLLP